MASKAKSGEKKRKLDLENRIFNPEWSEKYCFVERFEQAQCVICYKTVAAYKEYNIRRHWETNHSSHPFASLKSDERKAAVSRLAGCMEKSVSFFHKKTNEADAVSRASYDVSLLIAQRMKPFCDGDFIKECLMSVVTSVCPERRAAFESVSLSSRTVRRRIEEMSDDVANATKSRCQELAVYSLALDESTDVKDISQLAIFIRGVTNEMDVHEEFLQLYPLHDTTTGRDISDAVIKCMTDLSLDFSRLMCITTDGAPAMIGDKKGAASLIARHCQNEGHSQTVHRIHCIIHQEALCAKSATLVDVMSITVKVVNAILSRSLRHRQFRTLLEEATTHYGDLLYFCEVRWLSRGAMLSRVWDLRHEIASFIRQEGLSYECFEDSKWIARLALLTDVCSHLNDLNLKLQGKDVLVTDMFSHVAAFEVKLRLWQSQLSHGQTTHFSCLSSCPTDDVDRSECAAIIGRLRDEFATRFSALRTLKDDFKIFTSPFDCLVDDAPADLQMDLVELQCDEVLKTKFNASSLIGFYKLLTATGKFTSLTDHAKRIISMFGSTYSCEQLFSKMKYCKSRLRSQMSDRHLNDILRLSSSSIQPNISSLVASKQFQPSH